MSAIRPHRRSISESCLKLTKERKFSAYSFGIYSSTILSNIYGDTAPLTTIFGWNTVINLFFIPGTFLGALVADWIEPRHQMALGSVLQALVGFIMAAYYERLSQPNIVGSFVVVFGLFMALGEFGPGNSCGLMASKTCATGIRGMTISPSSLLCLRELTLRQASTMASPRPLARLVHSSEPGVSFSRHSGHGPLPRCHLC